MGDMAAGTPHRPVTSPSWWNIPATLQELLRGQTAIRHQLQELIILTDALSQAVSDLQATDAALADAVAAFVANGAGPIQAALDAANATIVTLRGQVAQDVTDKAAVQASLDTAQAEIANAGAAVEAEVSKLAAVQASVTPPVV